MFDGNTDLHPIPLAIDPNTARDLALDIRPDLLARAHELIESTRSERFTESWSAWRPLTAATAVGEGKESRSCGASATGPRRTRRSRATRAPASNPPF